MPRIVVVGGGVVVDGDRPAVEYWNLFLIHAHKDRDGLRRAFALPRGASCGECRRGEAAPVTVQDFKDRE